MEQHKYHYRKEVGDRTIMNTNHPVYAIASGSRRRYVSGLLCNGYVDDVQEHRTRREAVERAEQWATVE